MRFRSLITPLALAILPALALVMSSNAAVQPSIEAGNIYTVRNVTKSTDFTDPNSADACDVLQYKVIIHNGGPVPLENVTVQATFPSGAPVKNVSTMTVSASNASPASTSDTATVNISSARSMSYVSGSSQLLNANGGVINNLPDGLTQGPIPIGNVGVSINERRSVQFQMKLDCPPTPPPPAYSCDKFTIRAEQSRKVTVTAFETSASNGAVFKNVVIDWDDDSQALTTANPVGQTHQYARDGTYVIKATAHFTVDGQDKTAGGSQCQQQVTFKTDTPPVVTPPTSTPPPPVTVTTVKSKGAAPAAPGAALSSGKLAAAGPASTAAWFVAVTILGALFHRWLLTRRLATERIENQES